MLQLCNTMTSPKIRRDGGLHIGDHGLNGLFADFRKRSTLVDHPAGLSAHAQSARFARVLGTQRLVELPDAARFFRFAKRVTDRSPAAPVFYFSHDQFHDCVRSTAEMP